MAPKTKPALRAPSAFEAAIDHHRAGRVGPAEASYRRALDAELQHAQAHFLLGALLLESGRAPEAAGVFEHGLASHPNDPLLLTNLGEAYRRLARFDEAATQLARAVTLKPESRWSAIAWSAAPDFARPRSSTCPS